MEKWQEKILTNSRADLTKTTQCTDTFIDKFAAKFLSQDEKEKLKCVRREDGNIAAASLFYDYIVKKRESFNILIKICCDEFQHAVAAILVKAANEAGKGDSLPDVDFGTSAPSSSSHTNLNKTRKAETNLSELPERLKDMVRYGKQIKFQFEMPTKNQPADRKNYALVINIITFPGHKPRDGADSDTENLVKLLENLNFTIFPEIKRKLYGGEWNKQDVIKQIESFKKKCIDDKVDSVVVFFGSHGCNDILQISELDYLDVYGDIIYELQVDVKDVGKKVPQIFINQSCQTDPPSNFKLTAIKPTVSDSLYVKAQIPKCKATRDAECGAYFVNALVYVLMKNARNTSLQNMLKEVQIRLKQMGKLADSLDSSKPKEEEDQMSTSTDLGLKNDFYFFENY